MKHMEGKRFQFFIRAGLFLIILSAIITIVIYLPYQAPVQKLKIDIHGNVRIHEEELRDLIIYMSRTQKEGLSLEEIKMTLLLNPFIEKVKIQKISPYHLIVDIKEVRAGYYEHIGPEIREKKVNGEIIQENILCSDSKKIKKIENFDQKIVFYLTKEDLNNNVPQKYKRDIILLWEKTHLQYYGFWQNISEIRFKRKNARIVVQVFPVKTNAVINVYSVWNVELLKKLEAVMVLLLKEYNKTFRAIDLYEKNAIVRYIENS